MKKAKKGPKKEMKKTFLWKKKINKTKQNLCFSMQNPRLFLNLFFAIFGLKFLLFFAGKLDVFN